MRRWFVNYETLACTGIIDNCTIQWLLKNNFQEVDKQEYDRIKAIVEQINTLKFELGIDTILRKSQKRVDTFNPLWYHYIVKKR